MPAIRYMQSRDFASSNTFLNAMFGEDGTSAGSFYRRVEEDQREACAQDSVEVGALYGFPEEWKLVEINQFKITNYKKPPRNLISTMKFGTVANFFADSVLKDMVPVLRDIKLMLHQLSPVRPSSMRAHHRVGLYRKSHEIYINGQRRINLSRSEDIPEGSVGQVVNRLDYAAVIEAPGWHRTYQKAFKKAQRKYGNDWDIRLQFADPDVFGGLLISSKYRKRPHYAVPLISVAPLNSLRNAGKFAFIKRRTTRSKPRRQRGQLAKFTPRRRS